MANPARWAQRAVRFAELYVDPAHGNYDPGHRIIRRPHNGSDPGRTGLFDGTHYPWLDREERSYGFPLDWLLPDGAPVPDRDQDPRLTDEMTARMGGGDTAVNLAAAGLVLNAWILTGDPRYRDWIEQVRRRVARARRREPRDRAGQRRPGRGGRQLARRALVRRALRLVLAAWVVQRRMRCDCRCFGGCRRDR